MPELFPHGKTGDGTTPPVGKCPVRKAATGYVAVQRRHGAPRRPFSSLLLNARLPRARYLMDKQTLLVTGGAGYIGSHTVVELLGAGHDVVILDNFSNSSPKVVDRIEEIAGRRPQLVEGDAGDRSTLQQLLSRHRIDATIHFAWLTRPWASRWPNRWPTMATTSAVPWCCSSAWKRRGPAASCSARRPLSMVTRPACHP